MAEPATQEADHRKHKQMSMISLCGNGNDGDEITNQGIIINLEAAVSLWWRTSWEIK